MKQSTRRIMVAAVLVCGLLGGGAFGAIMWHMGQSIRDNCRLAQQAHPHPGDDVAALIDFVDSPSHSAQERSHIGVWTLGRLRDPRALPGLEAVYTGAECEHDRKLCQYEVAKAIARCGGLPPPSRTSYH